MQLGTERWPTDGDPNVSVLKAVARSLSSSVCPLFRHKVLPIRSCHKNATLTANHGRLTAF